MQIGAFLFFGSIHFACLLSGSPHSDMDLPLAIWYVQWILGMTSAILELISFDTARVLSSFRHQLPYFNTYFCYAFPTTFWILFAPPLLVFRYTICLVTPVYPTRPGLPCSLRFWWLLCIVRRATEFLFLRSLPLPTHRPFFTLLTSTHCLIAFHNSRTLLLCIGPVPAFPVLPFCSPASAPIPL